MTDRHAIVIGAGAGGLAAGIDLARSGFRVTVLERAASPGGKMHTRAVADRRGRWRTDRPDHALYFREPLCRRRRLAD